MVFGALRRALGAGFDAQSLWAALDQCGIPFRTPLEELIAQHGTHPAMWMDGLDLCILPQTAPFLQGLAGRWEVTLTEGMDLTRAPFEFAAYVRGSDHTGVNFATALGQLRARFGAGTPGQASNTVSRSWVDGYARVTATVFPPDIQPDPGRNDRHEIIPGSATECALHIRPDWWPPLTRTQKSWLDVWQPVAGVIPEDPMPEFDSLTRPLPAGPLPGIGPSADKAGLVVIYPGGRGVLMDRARLTAVAHDVLTPARGPGMSMLSLRFETAGKDSRLHVAEGAHDDARHVEMADALASAFDLPLRTSRHPDV